jgi:hypothetical protein
MLIPLANLYPFATGEMVLKIGGKIHLDDREGTTYSGIITELKEPTVFAFQEVDDLLHILLEDENGCRMVFTHTFDDNSWAVHTAAGWHRCLDVFGQIVNGEPIEWKDIAAQLREIYSETFNMNER